jgi:pimeloyl-ACP methyl ester carboxylesterase
MRGMDHVTSADGTTIAYERSGDGPPVVIVNGAFSTARDAAGIAEALVAAGLRAVVYDRRGRAGSGDVAGGTPIADVPSREVEDLRAVVDAVGDNVAVLGHSSGAVLVLTAASHGLEARHLFLSEPPFRFGDGEPAADLPTRLQAMVDAGDGAGAVSTFQREGVGLPEVVVDQIRQSPIFDGLVALAQSTVYDATITRDVSTPPSAMTSVTVPVTILCGTDTFPMLVTASERLATAMPTAELVRVPESVQHRVDPPATARIVADRLLR